MSSSLSPIHPLFGPLHRLPRHGHEAVAPRLEPRGRHLLQVRDGRLFIRGHGCEKKGWLSRCRVHNTRMERWSVVKSSSQQPAILMYRHACPPYLDDSGRQEGVPIDAVPGPHADAIGRAWREILFAHHVALDCIVVLWMSGGIPMSFMCGSGSLTGRLQHTRTHRCKHTCIGEACPLLHRRRRRFGRRLLPLDHRGGPAMRKMGLICVCVSEGLGVGGRT